MPQGIGKRKGSHIVRPMGMKGLNHLTALNVASEEASKFDLEGQMNNDLASDSSSHYGSGGYGKVRFDSRNKMIKELDNGLIEKRNAALEELLTK